VFDVLNENMQGYNFKDKLVAQTYDGAAVMTSALNGLQAKVKAIAPSAMFVHCYAHRLNLVLSQGAKCLPECRIFFASLSGFGTFFSKSTSMESGVCRLFKVAQKCSYSMEFHITDSEHCGKQLSWPPAHI